jgi:hypothetical protein
VRRGKRFFFEKKKQKAFVRFEIVCKISADLNFCTGV